MNKAIKKADAYCWMGQYKGKFLGYVPVNGNWIKYEDYMELWNAYQDLLKISSIGLSQAGSTPA